MSKYVLAFALFAAMSVQAQEFNCQKFIKSSGAVYLNAREACGLVDSYSGDNCVIVSGIQIIPLNEKVSDFIDRLPASGEICTKGSVVNDGSRIAKLMVYDIRFEAK